MQKKFTMNDLLGASPHKTASRAQKAYNAAQKRKRKNKAIQIGVVTTAIGALSIAAIASQCSKTEAAAPKFDKEINMTGANKAPGFVNADKASKDIQFTK